MRSPDHGPSDRRKQPTIRQHLRMHPSMPVMRSSHQTHANLATHHSSPAIMMSSMIGLGMTMASSNSPLVILNLQAISRLTYARPQPTQNISASSSRETFQGPQHMSGYYPDRQVLLTGNVNMAGNNWQNNSDPINSNTTYATQSHAPLQIFPQVANDESDDEREDEPGVGSNCNDCGMIRGQSCTCDPLFD